MKKILSLLLAMIMVFSLATVAAAADNQDATYKKNYTATNADSVNPEETFTITYTKGAATDPSTGKVLKNLATNEVVTAPTIANSTVSYTEGELNSTSAGNAVEKAITVALSDIEWPYVGVYTYEVTETAGNNAGVVYDTVVRNLKVTVAYDEGTHTYYTAFVSLSLDDDNKDGITDGEKTDVFENVYNAGKLSVQKKVTGNLGDQEKVFNVKVKFTAPEGKTVSAPITYTDDNVAKSITAAAMADGEEEVTITLKHDETVHFANIPYGVTYTVVEDDYTSEGYLAAAYGYPVNMSGLTVYASDGDNINGEVFKAAEYRVMDSAAEDVRITNHKETTVDTGIALDSAPYFVILAVAMFGMVALVAKKRYEV